MSRSCSNLTVTAWVKAASLVVAKLSMEIAGAVSLSVMVNTPFGSLRVTLTGLDNVTFKFH